MEAADNHPSETRPASPTDAETKRRFKEHLSYERHLWSARAAGVMTGIFGVLLAWGIVALIVWAIWRWWIGTPPW